MSADALLSKLHKVRRTGDGRWSACCPAHDDRGPSLSVRVMPDGKILLHCFAGCSAEEVLGAVGMEFSDLMPERLPGEHKPVRHAFSAWDALKALAFECTFIQLCAIRLAKSQPLAVSDLERLHVAARRIKSAVDAIGGQA